MQSSPQSSRLFIMIYVKCAVLESAGDINVKISMKAAMALKNMKLNYNYQDQNLKQILEQFSEL